MVHVRKLEGKTYTFIVSGSLWRNSLVMQDEETGSLWSHITGEALDGELKGKKLSMIPSVQTSWALWHEAHPDTKVLKKEKEIKSSHYERYFSDPERTGIFRTHWLREKMPGKDFVYGMSRGPFALAVTEKKLESVPVLNVDLGGEPIVVARSSDGGVVAYSSRMDGRELHFTTGDRNTMRDGETGSAWDTSTGLCTSGSMKGKRLDPIIVRKAYWFAWSSFYPNTEVLE